jgi:hypothetical protein
MTTPATIKLRQGDVSLIPVDRVPDDASLMPPTDGMYVLAEGEATGHIHALHAARVQMYRRAAEVYLLVLAAVELRHGNPAQGWQGDHETLTVPEGTYIANIERDYTPAGARRAVD